MSEEREKCYFERDPVTGYLTGLTVYCLGNFQGFSFCHPGAIHKVTGKAGGRRYASVEELVRPDQFNKKIGREVAKGRVLKFKELLKEGKNEEEAFNVLYSGRMQKRITEYMAREAYREEVRSALDNLKAVIANTKAAHAAEEASNQAVAKESV